MIKWLILSSLLFSSIVWADGIAVNGININDDGSANNLTVMSTNGTGITTTSVANGAKLVINAPQGVQGVQGQTGAQGVAGQEGKQGVAGQNGTNGTNGTDATVDDSAKLVGDVALRLYDGKRVQLQAFDTYGYSFQSNEGRNMMYGMRLVFKLGKSYEERKLEKMEKQIELLEAIVAKE